jgi:polysaccharide biosynthesis/export protein
MALSEHSFRQLLRCAALVLALKAGAAVAQTQKPHAITESDLARQNMDHVAASSGQLFAIFRSDPGLFVELKRWIAKDATAHGQVIADADLTEEAIFARLEEDIAFRSVATALVQKYGYLRPEVNPNSLLAKQQELLMRERVRWIAQDEELNRSKTRQDQQRTSAQPGTCDEATGECKSETTTNSNEQQPGVIQGTPGQLPGFEETPNSPNSPTAPQPVPPSQGSPLLRTSGQDEFSGGLADNSLGYGSSVYGATDNSTGSDSGTTNGMRQPGVGSSNNNGQFGTDRQEDLSLSEDFNTQSEVAARNPMSTQRISLSSPNAPLDGGGTASLRNPRLMESSFSKQGLIRRADPYHDIPSLYDMYLQTTARPPELERFGMEVFQNGTRDLQMIPMDLPAGPDYVLGPGDAISVDLWGGVSRRFPARVDREGRISLPEVGPLLVAGKSLAEVQQLVQKTLRTQFNDVSADVSLARLRTIRIYVVGDVMRPGAYDVGSLSTPLNALFAAGGPTTRGSLRIVRHNRGDELVQNVDLYDLLLHGVKGNLERLENGDTVMIPPIGPEITIEGMVRRPAIYELNDEKSLADALALAGGLLPTALLRHIEVQRLVAHQKQTMLDVEVPAEDSSEEVTRKLQAFQIQDGDKIRIYPIASYAQDAVYLEGHVIRPGKYSYHDGMKVTDLIGSYKDLLPEPAAQYGEIIRLSAPDFRPTVESFNLSDTLADPAKATALHALDTVQIFGRYDFEDPPAVSVLGDVRSPGTYRTSGDIHLSDAIHLAGGLTPDAQLVDAQVFRYQPDSTLKILNVKLDGALTGNSNENIMLKPRDRVLVHRNAAAMDPATVYVKGAVARPGRYPLTAEMHISDLIRAAGGLKPSADTRLADLTHYSWVDERAVTASEQPVLLESALGGNPESNPVLGNGDVLAVRELPNWDDLGATVTIRGEVVHPGGYGIRPGERLSSVLQRAGGLGPGAYPYGAVLLRSEVQKVEQRSYGELVQRVREQQASLKLTATSSTDPDQRLSAESAFVQWQTTLDNLITTPPTGRVTVQISSNIKSWQNTPRDITMRAGDVLVIPKRPSYVMVQGQVYGPTAVAYRPGKSARWYLLQAGGPTNMANKKATFVIRADGTVIGNHSSFWNSGDGLGATLEPGDMVVVPEKALGGPPVWKTIFTNAQVVSSIATSAILAASYF